MIQQWKNTVPVLYRIMYSFKGWKNNKNHAFPTKHCIGNEITCHCYTFYNENHTTYLYINCNEKPLFVKKSQPTVGIHWLLHSSCCYLNTNTVITQQLFQKARTLEAEWWQVCREAWVRGQRNESSTGRVWAAGFHHVMACSCLACILNLMNHLFLPFPKFFSGHSKPQIQKSACIQLTSHLERKITWDWH